MNALLKRGTPVIISEDDRPSAPLVAVLTHFDDRKAVWHGLYLLASPNLIHCSASYAPTPIRDFGVTLETYRGSYRCVPTGETGWATYRDWAPRRWQDGYDNRWLVMHQQAFAELDLAQVRRVEGRAA